MYLISFYVPSEHKEEVKDAMFRAKAGKIGQYESCSFETKGKGQFKPLKNSNPHVGKIEQISKVDEFKVEMVCEKKYIQDVIAAMKTAHPYEEVAYSVIKLETP